MHGLLSLFRGLVNLLLHFLSHSLSTLIVPGLPAFVVAGLTCLFAGGIDLCLRCFQLLVIIILRLLMQDIGLHLGILEQL